MISSKPYILIFVIIILVGAIYFINSQGVKRTGSSPVITVTPRVSSQSNTTTVQPISNSNSVPPTPGRGENITPLNQKEEMKKVRVLN